jgi:hypothetical protein
MLRRLLLGTTQLETCGREAGMLDTRRFARSAAGILMVLSVAACQDAALGPDADGGRVVVPSLRRGYKADTAVTIIRTDPTRRVTYGIGRDHRITFPKYSICDPKRSTYGPLEWDAPCEPATYSIKITAVSWYDREGHPRVEFSPELRFVPTTEVILAMRDEDAAGDPQATILFCVDLGTCFDDALLDPSLQTVRDPKTGFLSRRIKHFSGYHVAARGEYFDPYDYSELMQELNLGSSRDHTETAR